jgi:hypothetical protein
MDVAYFLGLDGPEDYAELRLSLRSFEKFYPSLGRVWICGPRLPVWMDEQRVTHLWQPDPYRHNKDANLIHKLLRLCLEPEISEPFILSSDDHFCLRPLQDVDFQPWRGAMPAKDAGNTPWQKRLVATCHRHRCPNFDMHVPYPIFKAYAGRMLEHAWGGEQPGTVFTTYYGAAGFPGRKIDETNIRADFRQTTNPAAWQKKLKLGNRFGLLGPGALRNAPLMQALWGIFPEKSSYEL